MTARIHAIETAVPGTVLTQDRARDVFAGQPGRSRLGERLTRAAFDASGIRERHTVLDALVTGGESELVADGLIRPAATSVRTGVYAAHAPRLAAEAGERALAASGFAAAEVTQLVTVSCTGFVAPGPDLDVVRALGLPTRTARLHVGFMGCCGAFPALRAADAVCRADPEAVVLVVCVELCTVHLATSDDPEQIVAMSLFADGAAAVVVSARAARGPSLAIDGFLTEVLPDTLEEMTWRIGDQGFVMRLSSRVPAELGATVGPALAPLLPGGAAAVDAWAVHPGGRAILDRLEEALELPPAALGDSRAVLADFGNMSSPTVLFVLRRLLAGGARGSVCAMAFGPGLTLEAALLHAEDAP
ncbi:type III polyketide synthase [Protaetiibacter intestinalis]|uniref:Type III polyketide synthase n=1 Tax=Protaetiibacter intestinalis TaxID=2419774 RepID=A0A387BCI6_9MICO|nr:type III polyketide synthase [Protaetiibacter intestinalis]AYF98599.1 type III polyketide synthase [Protaetiibacter intestinalis]